MVLRSNSFSIHSCILSIGLILVSVFLLLSEVLDLYIQVSVDGLGVEVIEDEGKVDTLDKFVEFIVVSGEDESIDVVHHLDIVLV